MTICLYSNSNTISEKGMDLNPWFLFNIQSFSTGSAKVGINKKRWKGTTSMAPIMNCQSGEFSISLMESLKNKVKLR